MLYNWRRSFFKIYHSCISDNIHNICIHYILRLLFPIWQKMKQFTQIKMTSICLRKVSTFWWVIREILSDASFFFFTSTFCDFHNMTLVKVSYGMRHLFSLPFILWKENMKILVHRTAYLYRTIILFYCCFFFILLYFIWNRVYDDFHNFHDGQLCPSMFNWWRWW